MTNDQAQSRAYSHAKALLDGGDGYEKVLKMKQRFEQRLHDATERVERLESRRNYLRLQHIGVQLRVKAVAADRVESEDEQVIEAEIEKVLDKAVGRHLLPLDADSR